MRKLVFLTACALLKCACADALPEFELTVTNALNQKSCLVSSDFTNYIWQCASQGTNAELSLSARIIMGVSQLEIFNESVDETALAAAFHSVSNALASPILSTNQWQNWHIAILNITCLNTANDLQGAYSAASNAWDSIQLSGFVDSTNLISRSLIKYYGIDSDISIKATIALYKALAAEMVGKHEESNSLKVYLPDCIKQKMERFLSDE